MIVPALPNIPWEDRPTGHNDILWRSGRQKTQFKYLSKQLHITAGADHE
jgi:hypothetical protein